MTSPLAVDLFRNDGVTAYSHDVQVDGEGIAWVSGAGGVRGYWTEGVHNDPLRAASSARRRRLDPIPYAGGEFDARRRAPSEFMHNAFRAAATRPDDGPRPGYGYDPSKLILATEEEDAPPDCNGLGQFSIASLRGLLQRRGLALDARGRRSGWT